MDRSDACLFQDPPYSTVMFVRHAQSYGGRTRSSMRDFNGRFNCDDVYERATHYGTAFYSAY